MHATSAGDRVRWVVAAGSAVVVLGALLALFRFPAIPTVTSPRPSSILAAPQVQIAKSATGDAVLTEELALRDMRPLFLPTERNVTVREPRREPGRTFLADDTLKLSFGDADLDVDAGLPPVATINGKRAQEAASLDAVGRDAGDAALHGFGRAAATVEAVRPRGAAIDVVAVASGHEVLSAQLAVEARPPGNKPWEPLELLAAVDAAGLIAPLVVTSSSRVDEVDAYFRNFLARGYRIGDRLPPGFYRITVSP